LQMLDKDIEEAEEHYSIALRNHFIHINQLISLQESRIKGLTEEFNKDVINLENEFTNEFNHIKINFKDEKKEIMNMTEAIKLEYQEKMNKVVEEFRIHQETINSKIKDKYQRLQEKLKKSMLILKYQDFIRKLMFFHQIHRKNLLLIKIIRIYIIPLKNR